MATPSDTPPTELTEAEKQVIKPFFSNLDKDIFVLTNLPEVIKGTLFSRYSRSSKTVRRLLLDEFIPDKDVLAALEGVDAEKSIQAGLAISKAESFYERVLVGYGDDSVAELAGVHVACENISSLAADALTDSRIGLSYLEKSARYLLFDKKVNGKYLWYRAPTLMGSKFSDIYEETMERIFDSYSKWVPIVLSLIKERYPQEADTTDRAYQSASQAKACDVLKNMLPAGRLTNLGLYGNGRAYEYLLTKLYSSDLEEAKQIAKTLHEELSKVIPSFVKRSQTSEYITGTRDQMRTFISVNIKPLQPTSTESFLQLIDYDPDSENKVLAGMLYPYLGQSMEELIVQVKAMSTEKKKELIHAYLSKRRNRRDKAGRALENSYYTFDICANYGMFRDIHRHRVLSMEKQLLNANLGFDTPEELAVLNLDKEYSELMNRIIEVYNKIATEMPIDAQYIVPRAFHMHWYMKLNLREAYHFAELRSSRQGHIDYRKFAQKMKLLVQEEHPLLVEYMQVDMNEYALPRLESEKRIDEKIAKMDKKQSE